MKNVSRFLALGVLSLSSSFAFSQGLQFQTRTVKDAAKIDVEFQNFKKKTSYKEGSNSYSSGPAWVIIAGPVSQNYKRNSATSWIQWGPHYTVPPTQYAALNSAYAAATNAISNNGSIPATIQNFIITLLGNAHAADMNYLQMCAGGYTSFTLYGRAYGNGILSNKSSAIKASVTTTEISLPTWLDYTQKRHEERLMVIANDIIRANPKNGANIKLLPTDMLRGVVQYIDRTNETQALMRRLNGGASWGPIILWPPEPYTNLTRAVKTGDLTPFVDEAAPQTAGGSVAGKPDK